MNKIIKYVGISAIAGSALLFSLKTGIDAAFPTDWASLYLRNEKLLDSRDTGEKYLALKKGGSLYLRVSGSDKDGMKQRSIYIDDKIWETEEFNQKYNGWFVAQEDMNTNDLGFGKHEIKLEIEDMLGNKKSDLCTLTVNE